MRFRITTIILFLLFLTCKNNDSIILLEAPILNNAFDDKAYVLNDSFPKGDVRRYGIYPDNYYADKDLLSLMELADHGIPLKFVKGTYYLNLLLQGLSDVKLVFDDAIIAGTFQIIDKDNEKSQRLVFEGKLTVLDKVFMRNSNDIKFDTLLIKSNKAKSLYKKKNRGMSIYLGTKNIEIRTLEIEQTGGTEDDFFKYSAAAFQVHGWNNNPEGITIDNLLIKNTDRTALYLTGKNHSIKRIKIENFGLGTNKNMFGLEDAELGSERDFVGAWFNKCNDCTIDTLQIYANDRSRTYSARFDLGFYPEPCIIENIEFNSLAKDMPIYDNVLTNVLVKNELEHGN
ncbi:hypothetical protein J4050_00595 [Winogradskyella sp. DF17]|uniref:Uncharacterized protein n=1 Tax=Winogradskyella pelagia TaxID=2819984 RepID=A0ABS3SXK2_9FLAO|nr:hypothetical protein [Winogradskyella sp. DF17]MBO3115223.1 hypothetical protein [Winogradskyella sp. DF17]